MNAIARQDFSEFIEFARAFSIREVMDDPGKVAEIRKAHGQFLALLTSVGELTTDAGSVSMEFLADYLDEGKNYLGEVVSDSSEFMVCVLLGLCRSGGGTLRSAIESYVKAFSAKEQPLILRRTSVPDVFNDAAGVSFFSSVIGRTVLAELRGVYSELNAYVHTVSNDQMFGVIAVGSFPRWSDNNVKLIGFFVRVTRLFLYGMTGVRRDFYDRFDHRNKVVVNRAMTRQQRRSAMGVDD